MGYSIRLLIRVFSPSALWRKTNPFSLKQGEKDYFIVLAAVLLRIITLLLSEILSKPLLGLQRYSRIADK